VRQKSELRQAKEYMESMINSLVDPMVTTDIRGIITSFREGVQEFLGYKNEEAIGRHISLCYKDGKEEAKRIMMALEKYGKINNHEMIFVSKDGREIPSLISVSFLRDAKGKITGTLGIAKDISDRKRLENALREREELFFGTLNEMLTFVGILEPTGKLIFVNNAPLLAAGIKLEDVVGKMFYDTYWLAYSEEAREMIKEDIEACASGKTVAHEIQAQMADSLIWIEFSMHPIYDEKGKVKYLVPEGRDITERKRMEDELKKTKDFLERILESSTDSIVTTDMDGKITFANAGAEAIFGYGKGDTIGTHISQYYTGGLEEAKKVGKIINEEGRLHFGEIDFLKKDRTGITLSMSYDLLRDDKGIIIGMVAVGKDVTEKKRIERELIQTKDSLESVIEGITDPIVTTDTKGIVTSINKALTELVGYEREDAVGKRISFIYGGGIEYARKMMGLLSEQGIVRNHETQFVKKDGSLFPAIVSMSLLRDKSGEVVGTLGICKDITDRKRLEEELKETKDFLESVIEGSIDGITTLDNKGNITFVSKGTEEMLGYKRENILGTHISEYYLGGMEAAKRIMMPLREKGRLRNYETALVTADGHIVPISVSASYLRDDKGEIIGTLGIYKDISENKRLETDLKETKNFLENMVESSIDAIVTTDRKGIVNFTNRGTTDMMGHKLEEMIGNHVSKYYAGG
jgi:PAS domain S-box-containing protein